MNVLRLDKRHPLACNGYSDVCAVCTVTYCTSLFYCAFVAQLVCAAALLLSLQ